jgi:class 3 adenylate cyclase
MERLAFWLWRRWPTHFEGYYLGIGVSAGVVVVGLPTATVASLYLGLDRSSTVTFAAVVCVVIAVGTPITAAVVGRPFFVTVRRFARGDHADAEVAHATFIRMARSISIRTALVLAVVHLGTTCVVGARLAGLSAGGFLALVFAVGMVLWAGAVLMAAALELLLLPACQEAAAVRASATNVTGGRLSYRLTMLVGAVAWFSAMIPGAITAGIEDPETRWVLAVVSASCVAATLTVAYFRMLGLPSVLRPVKQLLIGTRQVSEGDLTVAIPVTSDDELAELAGSFNEMVRGLDERERLRAAFGSYVSPVLARRLAAQTHEVFAGEEVEVTVLFADIRGFTAYADRVDARVVVATLNELFELIVPLLRQHGGHPNKYLGDGLLAVFGTPEPLEDHASSAVAASIAIQQALRSAYGDRLTLGIGINTGSVIAGTIGGGGKLEFTLIGDAVNIASRVEQLTKETNDLILLTEATRARLSEVCEVIDRGEHVLRGKPSAIHLYAVDPTSPTRPDPLLRTLEEA